MGPWVLPNTVNPVLVGIWSDYKTTNHVPRAALLTWPMAPNMAHGPQQVCGPLQEKASPGTQRQRL